MNNDIPDNWYENFFSGINCELWEKAVTPEWTANEVGFLMDVMNIKPPAHILDIPCGEGRHSISLAKKGFHLTSVDISEEFIQKLRKKVTEERLPIDVIHENIVSLKLNGTFDGAFCLGNSFGFFNYTGIETFVNVVAACLRPGARFVINSGMLAESILPHIPESKTYALENLTMHVANKYIAGEGYMISHLTYRKRGKTEEHSYKHYVFTLSEVKRLLNLHNLKTIAVYNSTKKTPYQLGDAQAYLVAEKV